MNKDLTHKIKKMARQAGYHDIKPIGIWNGYKVFEPIYTDDFVRYQGYPQFLLAKGDTIRWSNDYTESIAIMDAFPNDEDDE